MKGVYKASSHFLSHIQMIIKYRLEAEKRSLRNSERETSIARALNYEDFSY